MNEVLMDLDWGEVLSVIWTAILLPVLTYLGVAIKKWAEAKNIAKYTDILWDCAMDAVKDVYETIVKDIKGTDQWTTDKMVEVKEMAKTKTIAALTSAAYQCLSTANEDFDDYLDTLIESCLFDIKNK